MPPLPDALKHFFKNLLLHSPATTWQLFSKKSSHSDLRPTCSSLRSAGRTLCVCVCVSLTSDPATFRGGQSPAGCVCVCVFSVAPCWPFKSELEARVGDWEAQRPPPPPQPPTPLLMSKGSMWCWMAPFAFLDILVIWPAHWFQNDSGGFHVRLQFDVIFRMEGGRRQPLGPGDQPEPPRLGSSPGYRLKLEGELVSSDDVKAPLSKVPNP